MAHDRPCTDTDPKCTSWSKLFVYPVEAVRQELEGTVTVAVVVDPQGHAQNCRIVISSGHDLLDKATCAQFEELAHFNPALDEDGKPVLGNYSSKITWRLTSTTPILSAID